MKYLSCDGKNQEHRESTNLGNFVPHSVASLFGQSFTIYVYKNSSGMLDILNFSDIIKNTDKTCAYLMHNKLIGFIFMEGPW